MNAPLQHLEPRPVPNPEAPPAVQRFFALREPYAVSEVADDLYVAAMNELTAWHADRSEFYRSLWNSSGRPTLAAPADAAKLPSIHAAFFKSHEVRSVSLAEVHATLTSSGTSGQKSQVFLDEWSLATATGMAARIIEHYGFVDHETSVDYLLFGYEPAPSQALGTAFTDNFLCEFAPARNVAYALRATHDEHVFDPFGCMQALLRAAEDGVPLRLFGFPAFVWFTLERMRERGIPPLELPTSSLAILGGGWKGHADAEIGKLELYERMEQQLGIPHTRVRDMYGAVEHGVTYLECARHNLHAPIWSRVSVRDVRTLEPLPWGRRGFLHLAAPNCTSMPTQSLLMGDLAALYPGDDCGCGLQTPWFVVYGRAGTSRSRSCAVAAAELLGGRRG